MKTFLNQKFVRCDRENRLLGKIQTFKLSQLDRELYNLIELNFGNSFDRSLTLHLSNKAEYNSIGNNLF